MASESIFKNVWHQWEKADSGFGGPETLWDPFLGKRTHNDKRLLPPPSAWGRHPCKLGVLKLHLPQLRGKSASGFRCVFCPFFTLRSPFDSFPHFLYGGEFDHSISPSEIQTWRFQNIIIMQLYLVTQRVTRNTGGVHNRHSVVCVCNISKQIIWNWAVTTWAGMVHSSMLCKSARHTMLRAVPVCPGYLGPLPGPSIQRLALAAGNRITESFQLANCL